MAAGFRRIAGPVHAAAFAEARCRGSRFTDADLSFADFSRAELTLSEFSGANLHMANLHGALETDVYWADAKKTTLRGTDPDLEAAENWTPPA